MLASVSANDLNATDEVLIEDTSENNFLNDESKELTSVDESNEVLELDNESNTLSSTYYPTSVSQLKSYISSANAGDTIILSGTYKIHDYTISKELTFIGTNDATLDGEDNKIFSIKDSIITFKNIIFKNGYGRYGGTIDAHSGQLIVDNCKFLKSYTVYSGGTLFVDGTASCKITNSYFTNSKTGDGYGGAIKLESYGEIINCTFEGCSATDDGGAIRTDISAIIENCTFKGCKATNGGGISSEGSTNSKIIGSTFINCNAKYGGAIGLAANSKNTLINNCTFIGNTATDNGGAISRKESDILNLQNCYFEGNSAKWGGAVYMLSNYVNGEVFNCTFKNNHASADSGAISGGTLNYCKFIGNSAANVAGAAGWAVTNHCTFDNNHADVNGGALCSGSTYDSTFINNSAGNCGGAFVMQGKGEVHRCTFIDNSAKYGGAICKPAGDYTDSKIINSDFTGNRVSHSGGALCIQQVTSNILDNCSFANNHADGDSGAVDYYQSSNIKISNCEFINSSCSKSGGSIGFWDINSITLTDCNFSDSAANKGGAIYWDKGQDLDMSSCQFENCVSNDGDSYIKFGSETSQSYIVDCVFDVMPSGITVFYDSILRVNNISIVSGEEGIITAKLSNMFGPLENQQVTFYVDNHEYTKPTDNKGIVYFRASDYLSLGSYVVNVSYAGEGFKNPVSVNSIVRINNYMGNLTVTQRGKYYDDSYLDFKLIDSYNNPINNAQINLEFSNGKVATLKTDEKGQCSYKVPLAPGTYSFRAYDIASNVDVNTVNVNDFEIKKLTGKIELSREGVSRKLNIKVYNPENGDVYRNVKVVLAFSDGVNRETDLTNENGQTSYYMGFVYGTYSVSARTTGDYQEFDTGYMNNIVINANSGPMDDIHSVEVAFNKKSLVFEYTKTGSVTVAVIGGNILQENIEVLGYPGVAKISNNVITVSELNVGHYSLRILPTADAEHYSEPVYFDIVVNKVSATLKASSIKVPLKKSNLWKITLKDHNTGKPISNMKISLKVFTGKKYKTVFVTTNSNGEASYNTRSLTKGTHKIVASINHGGYDCNKITSSIKVIKQTKLQFKVKKNIAKDGSSLSITVKKGKKPINGIKINLLVYTGKKYKTITLKTKTNGKYKGVCGWGTNKLTVGTHKIVIMPANIKYNGSKTVKMTLKKSAKKYPNWETKI